ncbi:putative cationic amino acid transporter [Schistosoma mansoni]|uniref:putative cationic amino acid transporter n=1 Tax=Schistosoma mansoni TaxID=6183 RepID=UPI00022DBFBF|nr:putative cationic amino acid transporter [Schistosoma mansoni]|eukprot:XP_018653184.1 putative cationic amino acid transporter [Schistosoma mansoni]
MPKISFGNNYHYAYPNFSTELSNSIYSITKCFTPTTTTTTTTKTITSSITTDNTLSDTRFHYPILSNSQQNITHSITTNTTNDNNTSMISPYTIGSLISDPLKNNSSNPTINLLFNIQQQVLMTGLLQTWQQQQHSQRYHELKQQQQSEQNKDSPIPYDTRGRVTTYPDDIINMTSPITATIPINLSPSNNNNNVTQITRTITASITTLNGTTTTTTVTSTTMATSNTPYHTMFRSIANHQLPGLLPSSVTTTVQSQMNENLSIDFTKHNKLRNSHLSMNLENMKSPSDWSVPSSIDSLELSNSLQIQNQPRHQLQVNRFFTPGRRKESHRLLTKTNTGRKSAPVTSLFNSQLDVNNSTCTGTNISNNNSTTNSNINNKEEQWKRFQCSGCGHRSNWKWDINKHIKVAHPERTNIITITLDLEDAKSTYNEYMNRMKLSRNRYLTETNSDISTNSSSWITCVGLTATTSTTTTNSAATTTITTNTGEGYYRPFKCSVCGHRSNWKWDVGKHIKQIHNGNGEVQTLSLEEARRTIHQYKNRRRQHHNHHHRFTDLTIKCEPSFCSSSESNVNLSPVSLSVGEDLIQKKSFCYYSYFILAFLLGVHFDRLFLSFSKSSHGVVNPSLNNKIELKREVGLWSAVSITIGTIIGSGVFVTPKGVLENSEQSPGISIIIWILCGIISLLGSLCYAELGTTITDSGGDYVYIKKAFGNLPAFLQLWVNLVVIRPTSTAICAFSFAYYALYPIYSNCDPPYLLIISFSILSITFLTWINIMKVRWATRIQNLFTAAKLLALTIIILSGLYVLCQSRLENFEEFWQPTRPMNPSRIALAFYSGLFAYAGWNFLNIITEELQNPQHSICCHNSISFILFIFCCHINTFKTFADRLYGKFSWIMSIFISLSCFGGLNGILFTSGRLNFVAAREGQLPILLATIHVEHLTPVPSILLNCCLSLIMLIVSDLFTLINYVSFVQWLSVAASILAMLYLRRSQPNLSRPIHLPLIIPITFLLICGFLLIFPIFHRPKELFIGMIIVLSGIPIYLIGIGWKRKSNLFIQKYSK